MSSHHSPRESRDAAVEHERSDIHAQLDTLLHTIVREHAEKKVEWSDVTKELTQWNVTGAMKNVIGYLFGTGHSVRGLGYDVESVDHLSASDRKRMLEQVNTVERSDPFRRQMMASVARYQLQESVEQEGVVGKEKKTKEDRAIEFLERNVQPGDVLIVSQGGKRESFLHETFEVLQRSLHAKREVGQFHGTHSIVATQAGLIHITQMGKHQNNIRETFAKGDYNAVTVLRLPDPKSAQEFAVRAQSFADRVEGYNMQGMISSAVNPKTETVDGKTCICTDYVSKSLDQTDPKLKTIPEIVQSGRFQLLYSMDFGREENLKK